MSINICDVHTNKAQKETTTHGSVIFPVACYEDNMELISVPMHWHDEFEIIFVIKGKLFIQVGPKRLCLSENSAVFINSGCLHSVESVSNGSGILRSIVIHPKLIGGNIDSVFWQDLIMPFVENEKLSYIILDTSTYWHNCVIEYMKTAWDVITCEPYDYENYSRYLLSKSFRILIDNSVKTTSSNKVNTLTNTRMKQLIQYIEEHYFEDITTQILMEQISSSESVLLRCFKQTVGTSPMRFILDYRIEKASSMLLTTMKKSCEIAIECGFNDFSYFTKVFRQKKGITPVEYRKKYSKTRHKIS